MRLPIDTSAFRFMCSTPPEPAVDFDSKQPKVDRDGEPIFSMELVAVGPTGSQIFNVKFSGTPVPMKQLEAVKVVDLVVSDWQNNGKFGLAFRAARIEPVNGHGAPSGSKSGGAA